MVLIVLSFRAFAQETMISLSGGYSFANIKDSGNQGTGYNIMGNFEFNPSGGQLVHGISFGYVYLMATDGTGPLEVKSIIHSYPVYYAPKYLFGKDKLKGFIKGAIGMQYADLRREGLIKAHDMDLGFFGGGGAGIMLFLSESFFINAEYDIDWASNSEYQDGWINSAIGGIGIKF